MDGIRMIGDSDVHGGWGVGGWDVLGGYEAGRWCPCIVGGGWGVLRVGVGDGHAVSSVLSGDTVLSVATAATAHTSFPSLSSLSGAGAGAAQSDSFPFVAAV